MSLVKPKIKAEKIGYKKLLEAKDHFKAIVMDQDGTIKGGIIPKYSQENVLLLIEKIILKNKYPSVITGSGVSALRSYFSLNNLYKTKKYKIPTYIGIGNGNALYKFDINGCFQIYNYPLSLKEIIKIIKIYEKIYLKFGIQYYDLKKTGLVVFNKFNKLDWRNFIHNNFLAISRTYKGRLFAEEIKVSFVFPDWNEEKQRTLVVEMQNGLDIVLGKNQYYVSRGDSTFMHINKNLGIDPKLFALKKIMLDLKITKKQIIAFGDMPRDNDRGLLIESGLPFVFTNEYLKNGYGYKPYILPGSKDLPINSVYSAINNLLS